MSYKVWPQRGTGLIRADLARASRMRIICTYLHMTER